MKYVMVGYSDTKVLSAFISDQHLSSLGASHKRSVDQPYLSSRSNLYHSIVLNILSLTRQTGR